MTSSAQDMPTVRALPTAVGGRYDPDTKRVHLTGVQALVRLPMDVMRRDRAAAKHSAALITGYEGSPLGGYDLQLQQNLAMLDGLDIVFRPGVNEELAATAAQGSQQVADHPQRQWDGVTAFWYGKSPGLDRASDALRHANLAGTSREGGAVAFVGDDPAAKSSTVPGASEGLLADLGIPTLFPADAQEVLEYGIHAVEMSRLSGLWTALKIATNVADGSTTVRIPHYMSTVSPDMYVNGTKFEHRVTSKLLQPHLDALETSRDGVRREIALRYIAANKLNRIANGKANGARIGLVAAGKTYQDMRQALSSLGLEEDSLARNGVRLLKLGVIFPLESGIIEEFASGLEEIIVVEEKRPFLESQLKQMLYGAQTPPRISGKYDQAGKPLMPFNGELDVDKIARALAPRLSPLLGDVVDNHVSPPLASLLGKALPVIPGRAPYFCSGCPHSRSTQVPAGSMVGAGIGCHGLVVGMNPDIVGDIGGLTQMGGEGAQWIGMEPFLAAKHLFQNIGDGTFHHSGSLAIRAAVASGSNITYKILYNSAVAMTGGQQAVGNMQIPELARLLTAEGVRHITITTDNPRRYRRAKLPPNTVVWSTDRLVEAQSALSKMSGVTVLIHDQECATELRRKRKRGLAPQASQRAFINERICEGCGDCGRKSNCLSVHPIDTDFGRKTTIDQSTCNSDLACFAGDCPAFVSVLPSPKKKGQAPAKSMPQLLHDLPEPEVGVIRSNFGIRIIGIGGSGVVTTAQVIATAANLAGMDVQALDQTGLAQKGGAVVSDVKIGGQRVSVANKLSEGECDLLLAPDILSASDSVHLRVADPSGTNAVISTSKIPTGAMVSDVKASFPEIATLQAAISTRIATANTVFVDARKAMLALLGADPFVNIFLVGVAYQRGWLPIPLEHIKEAIRLNGSQIEKNLSALEFGRLFVEKPQEFERVLDSVLPITGELPVHPAAAGIAAEVSALCSDDLQKLILGRTSELIRYQSRRYAQSYIDVLSRVRDAEIKAGVGAEQLSRAVAMYLYKLMAYKDEYEVARLTFDAGTRDSIRHEFGRGAKVRILLHPPALKALGLKKKIRVGTWGKPAMYLLARSKFVRGTRLDIFGYATMRRIERELIAEYIEVIDRVCVGLDEDSLEFATQIARLPDMVRGYEEVKLATVEEYRDRLAHLLDSRGLAGS